VDQIEGCVDSFHGATEGEWLKKISLVDLHPVRTRCEELPAPANQSADDVAGPQELGQETATDVTGRACQKD
jgi:hypothetical protein